MIVGKKHIKVKRFKHIDTAREWISDMRSVYQYHSSVELSGILGNAATTVAERGISDRSDARDGRRSDRGRLRKRQRTPQSASSEAAPCDADKDKDEDGVLVASTDGACQTRGLRKRVASWAVVWHPTVAAKILSLEDASSILGGTEEQTNQRAELTAVVRALETAAHAIKTSASSASGICKLRIRTDSKWCVQGLADWIPRIWLRNEWKTSTGGTVKHSDLWKRAWSATQLIESQGCKVCVCHVFGHTGDFFNEAADRAAVRAIEAERVRSEPRVA